jgi:polysaccharide deacetylase 2 family uncharacterized protein YibQ
MAVRMPKAKKKKTIRSKRSKKRSNIGLFLIVGLIATVALWYLIKDPLPSIPGVQNELLTETPGSKKSPVKSKKHPSASKQSSALNSKVEDNSNIAAQSGQINFEDYITGAISKLGIDKSYYRRRKSGDTITFTVPIDRSSMDLIYANMIFKGEVERGGGKFLKGTESSAKQSLVFSSGADAKKYVVDLYYDKKLYAQKSTPRTIAIVVDDFGAIGGDLLDGFMAVDKDVCFAIFPDEDNSVLTMQRATAQGRETLIHVPMEPIGYPKVNPGKNAIFMQYDAATIDKMLSRFIKQLPDCEGINNHMGSLATTDEDLMRSVMTSLKKHNKFFLDSRTSNVSVAYATAQKAHLRAFRNEMFLDSPNISQSTLDAKFKQILELSATQSSIIVITHCHNKEKLQYLNNFISRIKSAGFTIVPLSKIGQYNVPELL